MASLGPGATGPPAYEFLLSDEHEALLPEQQAPTVQYLGGRQAATTQYVPVSRAEAIRRNFS